MTQYAPGDDSASVEYPSAQTAGSQTSGASSAQSAKDRAADAAQTSKQAGAEVAQNAQQAGAEVAQTAADKAKDVAQETKRQARDLFGEAKEQLRGQAGSQQSNLLTNLRSLSDELGSMSSNSEQSGLATELVGQAHERVNSVADWLESHEPGDLLTEVRNFAQRRPGAFLLGAALAGVVAGRLTRGVVAAHRDDSSDTGSYADVRRDYSSGYTTPTTYGAGTDYATTGDPYGGQQYGGEPYSGQQYGTDPYAAPQAGEYGTPADPGYGVPPSEGSPR